MIGNTVFVLICFIFTVLMIKPRTWHILSKHSILGHIQRDLNFLFLKALHVDFILVDMEKELWQTCEQEKDFITKSLSGLSLSLVWGDSKKLMASQLLS